MKTESKKYFIVLTFALIAIFAFIAYGNSLSGKFMLDDDYLIKNNTYIKSQDIVKIFTRDIGAGAGVNYGFYRPFLAVTYVVDYLIFGLNVWGYHLTNIILHIMAALIICWFIYTLFNDISLSLCASLLFVVHPIHTEAVAYISGRADPLALIFTLACFIFYLRRSRAGNPIFYILMLLSFVLALLSRETSLILLPLILLYHVVFRAKIDKRSALSLLFVSLIYIILRLSVLRFLLTPKFYYHTSIIERLPGFFNAIFNYFRLLLLPVNLHMEYGTKLFRFTDAAVIAGIFIVISLAVYGFIKRRDRLVCFSIAWFFISLFPVANIYPINAYMAEHWLYLPSIGIFMLLAKGLTDIYKIKRLQYFAAALILGMLTFYSCLTIKQNDYWKEPLAFYVRTLQYEPNSFLALNNLGRLYKELNKTEDAISLFRKAVKIDPNNADVLNSLGLAYKDLGKNDEAMESFEMAIKVEPGFALSYLNLGALYGDMGEFEESAAMLKKAIQIDPKQSIAYNNLGILYRLQGKQQLAAQYFQKAIELGHKVNPQYLQE